MGFLQFYSMTYKWCNVCNLLCYVNTFSLHLP